MKINKGQLALSLGVAFFVEILSAFVTRNSMELYSTLSKPFFAPPGWVFPVVWTVLFFLMGISSYLVLSSNSYEKENALKLYAVSLVVNFLWSVIFFNMEKYLLAFVWLLLLWYIVYNMIKMFRKIDPLAANLQIPYLVWLTFAGVLNLFVAIQNF